MIEAPSILTRLTTGRRGPAILGLVALALLHISVSAHQFEHSADHDAERHAGVCEACAAYSQLEDTAAPCASSQDISISPYPSDATPRADHGDAPIIAVYHCRAPPLS